MTLKQQLLHEIDQAPEPLLQSCLDLIQSHTPPLHPSPSKDPAQSDQPIWEIADEIIATIPDESFDHLPLDAAANLDHYLYGNSPQA